MVRLGDCSRGASGCRCSCCLDGHGDAARAIGLAPVVAGYCPYFRWEASGLGACVGRESAYYRLGCNVWPSKPIHIEHHPGCGYRFETAG